MTVLFMPDKNKNTQSIKTKITDSILNKPTTLKEIEKNQITPPLKDYPNI